MSQPQTASRPLALIACAVAVVGVAAIWAGISLITHGMSAWMAPFAALDAALLLRLASWPAGRARVTLALVATALTILCANYLVAAAQIGRALGLRPVESVPHMSIELAALYAQSNSGWFEGACYVVAALLAWVFAR